MAKLAVTELVMYFCSRDEHAFCTKQIVDPIYETKKICTCNCHGRK